MTQRLGDKEGETEDNAMVWSRDVSVSLNSIDLASDFLFQSLAL